MYELKWSKNAEATYNDLKEAAKAQRKARKAKNKKKSSKAEGLLKQVGKTVQLLASNPKHTGLNTHEYSSIVNPFDNKQKVFEAYAQNQTPGAYRVFWCYGPESKQITIIAITPHP